MRMLAGKWENFSISSSHVLSLSFLPHPVPLLALPFVSSSCGFLSLEFFFLLPESKLAEQWKLSYFSLFPDPQTSSPCLVLYGTWIIFPSPRGLCCVSAPFSSGDGGALSLAFSGFFKWVLTRVWWIIRHERVVRSIISVRIPLHFLGWKIWQTRYLNKHHRWPKGVTVRLRGAHLK